MAAKKPVSIGWQTIFCIINPVWVYGFYRIEKLRMGLAIMIPTIAVNYAISYFVPFPYSLFIVIAMLILVPIRFMRKWSREWNEKLREISS